MARAFYRHTKDVNRLLRDSATVSRRHYLRVLALASLDVLLTLPFGIVNITLSTIVAVQQDKLPFYPGWAKVHSNWAPKVSTWEDIQASGRSSLPQDYFSNWTSPVLALAIFGLFGLTTDARASYRSVFNFLSGCIERRTPSRTHDSRPHLGAINVERSKEMVLDIKHG